MQNVGSDPAEQRAFEANLDAEERKQLRGIRKMPFADADVVRAIEIELKQAGEQRSAYYAQRYRQTGKCE